jgi:hypothetical protein
MELRMTPWKLSLGTLRQGTPKGLKRTPSKQQMESRLGCPEKVKTKFFQDGALDHCPERRSRGEPHLVRDMATDLVIFVASRLAQQGGEPE